MYTKWTDHLPEGEQSKFKDFILGSKRVLDRAISILKQSLDATEKVELGTKWFDNPNWAYKQAYINGYKAGLTAAMELLNLDNQEHNNERFVSTGSRNGPEQRLPQRISR
jgi:hypothetical protein